MSFTHKHVRSMNRGNDDAISQENSVAEGSENNLSESIPDGSTDLAKEWHCDISAMKSLWISTTQDIVIETNNAASASASDTLDLRADQPVDWAENDVMDHPLSADVTMLYITNASGFAAQLEIREVEDPSA